MQHNYISYYILQSINIILILFIFNYDVLDMAQLYFGIVTKHDHWAYS